MHEQDHEQEHEEGPRSNRSMRGVKSEQKLVMLKSKRRSNRNRSRRE